MTEPGADAGGAQDLVGTILAGRYRIVAKLGEGAMGAVYVGEHLKMGRRDAIKVLRDAMVRDPEAAARFLRGARNVSTIRHPNVCTVYDFSDTDDGLQFLAMEFVAGETLAELLTREGALPAPRAVRIAIQIADALQAAHDAGVVHRDLKPGNIMIAPAPDGSDLVKVVDFDIAKGPADAEGAEVTRFGFVVGTPEYMSPEQLTGDALDGRSDVYSLGLVVFRMLTGGLPFQAKTTQDLMLLRLTERPLRLDEVAPGAPFPPGLQRILDRALARSRDERHAAAAEFGRDIAAALEVPATGPATQAGTAAGAAELATPPPADDVPPTTTSAAQGPEPAVPQASEPASAPLKPRRLVTMPIVILFAVSVITGWIVVDRFVFGTPPVNDIVLPPPEDGDGPPGSTPAEPGTPAVSVTALSSSEVAVRWQVEDDGAEFTLERTAAAGEFEAVATLGAGTSEYVDSGLQAGTVYRYRLRACIAERCSPFSVAASITTPPARVAETGRPAPEPEAPRPDGLSLAGLSPAAIEDVLFRQMDAVGPPYPARARLIAIRDTAMAVWRRDDGDPENRAWAAYIAGSALLGLGDAPECARWLERALALRPDGPGFRDLLEACRSRAR